MLKFAHATFDSQTPKAISWTMVKLGVFVYVCWDFRVFTQSTSIFEWHKPSDIDGKQLIKINCKVSASNLSFVLISSIPTPTWLLVFISVYLWSQLTHLYIDIFDYLLFPVISFLPSKWTNSLLITFRHILLFHRLWTLSWLFCTRTSHATSINQSTTSLPKMRDSPQSVWLDETTAAKLLF